MSLVEQTVRKAENFSWNKAKNHADFLIILTSTWNEQNNCSY